MEEFLGNKGERTLFNIECTNGKAIRAHSHFQTEEEILLLPGTFLQVVSKWSPSKDLHIIHLREATPPYQTIVPPFDTSSVSVTSPSLESLVISKESKKTSAASGVSSKASGNVLILILSLSGIFTEKDTPEYFPSFNEIFYKIDDWFIFFCPLLIINDEV